jgi:hypothetical protein
VNRANIQLHIDRLVLDGFNLSLRERQQLQTSIETELGRLLGERGLHDGLAQGVAVSSVSATPIQVARAGGQTGTALGQQIAASLYQSIGQQGAANQRGGRSQ